MNEVATKKDICKFNCNNMFNPWFVFVATFWGSQHFPKRSEVSHPTNPEMMVTLSSLTSNL